jgi:hypothetical protein
MSANRMGLGETARPSIGWIAVKRSAMIAFSISAPTPWPTDPL